MKIGQKREEESLRLRDSVQRQEHISDLLTVVRGRGQGSAGSVSTVFMSMSVCVHCAFVCRLSFLLETSGVDAGDWVELGDAALAGGVKALGLAGHLEEHFLFLQLPGKVVLQGLLPGP